MIRFGLFLLLLFAPAAVAGNYQPQDPLTNPGFVAFYNNDYDKAYAHFKKELNAHPNEPDSYNHLAQVVLYRELYRDGALESELVSGSNPFLHSPKLNMSPQAKSEFSDCIERSLKLNTARLDKDPHDIHALYSAGVAHGLSATYAFLIEKAWTTALNDAAAANRVNKQILNLDPAFVDARLIVGLYEYIVGNLPFYMRMLGVIGGFRGDKEGGIQKIEQVRQHGVLSKYDAEILLAVIYRREHCPQLALPLLKQAANRFPGNYLLRLEQVQMYSDLGNKNAALQVLGQVEQFRRNGAPGYERLPMEKLAYIRGNLLFWYNDLDGALAALTQATQKPRELDLSTEVMAWLRLGQTYDLKKNHGQAVKAYERAVAAAPQSAVADEAEGYISHPYRRKQKKG
jgi:tetratricopeptide (TPR) repeat protein